MVEVADVNRARRDSAADGLRVALEAEIRVGLDEQLAIDGAVRIVANDATFTHRLVLEDDRLGLLAMTFGATFVEPRHREAAGGFQDIRTVRVVALDAVHFVFYDGMMVRQLKLGVSLQMTLKTSRRILDGIENKFPATAASLNVQAAGAMTRFAAALPFQFGVFKMQPRMRACRKDARNLLMAIETDFVANESSTGNFRRSDDGAGDGGTRTGQK